MKAKTYSDELTCLTKGTDAGLYRLVPKKVVVVNDEEDVQDLLAECNRDQTPVTFKAGGTSLSGQTSTDSVLAEIGPYFGTYSISPDGTEATFPCGMTGEEANRLLKPYGRKLGPSPASIKSARISGIVANNASGSSYGITYNSYNTVKDMRIILSDGTLLDTSSEESRENFRKTHAEMLNGLMALRKQALDNEAVAAKIRHTYELKNTCGYGMNSLIDFEDPIEILKHFIIGSEGTLGFISSVTFRTVPDYIMKASALLYFPNIREACSAILPLRECKEVSAAELMDRNALRSVENQEGMPAIFKTLPEEAVALLIDTSANDKRSLEAQFAEIESKLKSVHTLEAVSFTTDPKQYATYWTVRNGLFTSAAAGRPKGTVSIIEDIAFRAHELGDALTDVRTILAKYNYADAVMWGHLLDGNVHFTISPDINAQEGVDKYADFMRELIRTVLAHDGSLKAEHGTGRNMAPFVKDEWGEEIYKLMWQVKRTIDPKSLLNPGVLLNDDPDIFIKNLKQIPPANELIDKCIECGFCEVKCPARYLSLTPRQRIVTYRALTRLQNEGKQNTKEYADLKRAFQYSGNETCATDGLCSTACPVGINTGLLIKELRWKDNSATANHIADSISSHMGSITAFLRLLLPFPHFVSHIIGYGAMEGICRKLFDWSGHRFPLWTRFTPSGAKKLPFVSEKPALGQQEIVYFPSCITRSMGKSADYNKEELCVTMETIKLLHRAGLSIRYPEKIHSLCCGMAFSSKGFRKQADKLQNELNAALLKVSENGRFPILCDMSPCLLHMRETLDKRLQLYEPVAFIHKFMLDRLTFHKLPLTVAVHATCSAVKMGVDPLMIDLASRCAEKVIAPPHVTCCGWAGDRGFFFPELNSSALRFLKSDIQGATAGYSNSRTCEIGLSINSGISYKSIVYLVDEATK